MTIKELKSRAHMTNQQLSAISGVPVRTMESWSSGRSTPPDYVVDMIMYKLKNEGCINLMYYFASTNSYDTVIIADRNDDAVILDERFFNCSEFTAESVRNELSEKDTISGCKNVQDVIRSIGIDIKKYKFSDIKNNFISVKEI